MPITWTHENVSRLFLVTLAVHHIHMDYKQIAAAFGGDASPRAIEEKMKKLRKEAREFSDGAIAFPTTRRPRGTVSGPGSRSKGTGRERGSARGRRSGKGDYFIDGSSKHEGEEDDSENEGMMDPSLYGDLMLGYLSKKETLETAPPIKMEEPAMFDHNNDFFDHPPQSQHQFDPADIDSVIDPALKDDIDFSNFPGFNMSHNMEINLPIDSPNVHNPIHIGMQYQTPPDEVMEQHENVFAFDNDARRLVAIEDVLRTSQPLTNYNNPNHGLLYEYELYAQNQYLPLSDQMVLDQTVHSPHREQTIDRRVEGVQ